MYQKLFFATLVMSMSSAWAGDSRNCPSAAQASMDSKFGAETSANTTCLSVRDNIKAVVNLSTTALNPRSGASQTLTNVKNMVENYEGMYGLVAKEDYAVSVVAHGAGARYLLSDEAYNRTYAVSTGNPSRAALEALMAKGVVVYMCQNTMSGNTWVSADILPGVKQVPAGVTALADYGLRGWVVLTP